VTLLQQNCSKTAKLRVAFDIFLGVIIRNGELDKILDKWHIPYLGKQGRISWGSRVSR
jgi:ABC-type amino acid transport substrate-binding protein